jgi:enoyl-CoA hydratase
METLRYDRSAKGVGVLRLARPKALNALNGQLLGELDGLLGELEHESQLEGDQALRALVVTGEGNRAFAAGADITEMATMSAVEAERFARKGQAVLSRLERLVVPTVAAVNGFALGGGCELALCCDLIIAGQAATFGQPEVRLGVIPGFGGTQRLVRRIGRHRATELILTGRNVKADEALRIGLALEIAPEDAVERAQQVALQIAEMGPVGVRLAKRALVETDGLGVAQGLESERTLFALCFATDDQKEGMKAFLEKRPAQFQGR